ncbi:hypothetical protein P261_00782 [Lachnospiraceae bacterium TWA4]|nr:hypothetical protein P261_00782 [Lachnospiraceae bacterium TWA4]
MYRKYIRKMIAPLMKDYGFEKVNKNSILYYKKKIACNMYVTIEIQKVRAIPKITCNITISEDVYINVYDYYRLGDFLKYSGSDIWWSIEESMIEESFIEIVTLMKERLFPYLEELNNEDFMKEYLNNKKIRIALDD